MKYTIPKKTLEYLEKLYSTENFDIKNKDHLRQIKSGLNAVLTRCNFLNNTKLEDSKQGRKKLEEYRKFLIGNLNDEGTLIHTLALILEYTKPPIHQHEEFLIDSHVHMKPTRKKPYDPSWIDLYIKTAKQRGIKALTFVEHFYSKHGNIRDIKNLPKHDDLLILNGLEVDVSTTPKKKGHVLIVGNYDALKDFSNIIESSSEEKPTVDELITSVDMIKKDYNNNFALATIAAHIFDPGLLIGYPATIKGVGGIDLSKFDASDHKPGNFEFTDAAIQTSVQYNLPLLLCSDAHTPFSLGNWHSQLPEPIFSIEDFIVMLHEQKERLKKTEEKDKLKQAKLFFPETINKIIKKEDPEEIKRLAELGRKFRHLIRDIGNYSY